MAPFPFNGESTHPSIICSRLQNVQISRHPFFLNLDRIGTHGSFSFFCKKFINFVSTAESHSQVGHTREAARFPQMVWNGINFVLKISGVTELCSIEIKVLQTMVPKTI